MAIKERLIEFMKYKDISVRKFCRTIGVSETYVNSMRNSMQPDKLRVLRETYPELSIRWMMTGEGEMLNKEGEMTQSERTKLINAGADVFKDMLIASTNSATLPKCMYKKQYCETSMLVYF